jgi:RNA polymerase sigma factor (sigma-70 family)
MKTFRVQIRIRNNQLIQRREELGLTQRALGEASGVDSNTISSLECVRLSPLKKPRRWEKRKDPEWTAAALRLSAFFGESPDTLFPRSVLKLKRPVAERVLDAEDLHQLTAEQSPMLIDEAADPSQLFDAHERRRSLCRALATLPPREELILRQRFGLEEGQDPQTREDLAEVWGLTPNRIRQLEAKAIRKLRHPKTSADLRDFYDG